VTRGPAQWCVARWCVPLVCPSCAADACPACVLGTSGTWYQWCLVRWCLVRWCLVRWCLVRWCLVRWCLVRWCLVRWCLVRWCLVRWCLVRWCLVRWCLVRWCVDVLLERNGCSDSPNVSVVCTACLPARVRPQTTVDGCKAGFDPCGTSYEIRQGKNTTTRCVQVRWLGVRKRCGYPPREPCTYPSCAHRAGSRVASWAFLRKGRLTCRCCLLFRCVGSWGSVLARLAVRPQLLPAGVRAAIRRRVHPGSRQPHSAGAGGLPPVVGSLAVCLPMSSPGCCQVVDGDCDCLAVCPLAQEFSCRCTVPLHSGANSTASNATDTHVRNRTALVVAVKLRRCVAAGLCWEVCSHDLCCRCWPAGCVCL
jgi:hypothetical protein